MKLNDDDGTSPLGLFNYGVAYIEAAKAVVASPQALRFSGPVEFLCAHGLELIFKGDLRRGRKLAEIRDDYGHRIADLFEAISDEFRERLCCDERFSDVVSYLAKGHSGPHYENRYLRTGLKEVIEPTELLKPLNQIPEVDRRWLISHFGPP